MKVLSEHKEYLSIGTLIVYFGGLLYYFFYFLSFGVNIVTYLSLQEVLINTLIFLITTLLGVAIVICIIGVLIYLLMKFATKKSSVNFNDSLIFSASILAVLSGIWGLIALYYAGISPTYISSVSTFTSIFSTFFLLSHYKGAVKNLFYFLIVFWFTTFFLTSSFNDAQIVRKGKSTLKFKFELDNKKVYSSNDSLYYIGETSSTIFLYNKALNNTIVINREHLVENSFEFN